jgi:hypothetical protein
MNHDDDENYLTLNINKYRQSSARKAISAAAVATNIEELQIMPNLFHLAYVLILIYIKKR